VAQTKKTEIRQAILDAAYELFSKRGYSDTNITDIARSAGVAPANLYVYFRSKLDILFSIYDPWLTKQFDEMQKSVAEGPCSAAAPPKDSLDGVAGHSVGRQWLRQQFDAGHISNDDP
jgi:AcrR family transcriptional regulator